MRSLTILLLLAGTMLAQNQVLAPASPFSKSTYDLSVGYSYLSMPMPSASRVSLGGLTAGALLEFRPRLAATAELGYAHDSDVLNTGHNGHVWSVLGRPVFYLRSYRNARMFTRFLVGTGLVDSAVPTSNGSISGWVSRPSYGFGGGVEKPFSGPFGIRIYGDYLRTAFADSSAIVQPQNNFRAGVSLVMRLRGFRRPRDVR